MLAFFSDEPIIQSIGNDSSGLGSYSVTRITGMQDDTALAGTLVYTNEVYVPDGYQDIEIGSLLRTLIEYQETNIRTLQFWNSQTMNLTQSTFAFNSYFTVGDTSRGSFTDYSVLYDTRGITTDEAGCTYNHAPYSSWSYRANYYPETELMQGQYISIMWRNPSNAGQMSTYSLGREYVYRDSLTGLDVQDSSIVDSSVTGQSFRYSGAVDWQEWCNGEYALKARFYLEDEKHTKKYITPWFTPRFCDDPNTVYLYWVNDMGGIDFVRSTETFTKRIEHEDSTYETGVGIDQPRNFGEEIYHQRKWHSYTFNTSIVSDSNSPALASVCGARWAWLYFPDKAEPWVPVTVEDANATVKNFENQGKKLYNYTFQLRDNKKVKTV